MRRKNVLAPAAVEDIEVLVNRALKGAILAGPEITSVHQFIKACSRWPRFFSAAEEAALFPLMAGLAALIDPCSGAVRQMETAVDEEGRLKDSASERLALLRRQSSSLQNRIQERLNEYLRSSSTRKYLQEALITIRNDRYVLPVKQEYRQHLEGIVHDQSASGQTFFIEPLPVVAMQNELTALKRSEEQEIERILYKLSSIIADCSSALLKNRALYAELDLIFAKGSYSLEGGCLEPGLQKKEAITLLEARHPFIGGEKVPLSVEFGEPVRTLVITGPNTGGKTVALKTIGLMAAMTQSGLQIPCAPGTVMPVFSQIRADIGDEQSIAQSLSTFSGHMKNIIEMIDTAGTRSLILLDELGAGTDPSEGAALAMAILVHLTAGGALTVATTHINELKLFAQVRPKMQNAAMEFDPQTLTPTYRLLQGVPGQSNAFYIAGKLGLPQEVMEKAKTFVHRAHDQVEAVITSLVEDRQRYHADSTQAALERSRAEKLLAELEKERELIRLRRTDILKEARAEARELVKKTRQSTQSLLRELKTIQSSAEQSPLSRLEEMQSALGQVMKEIGTDEEEPASGQAPQPGTLKKGDPVYICSLRQKGEVIAATAEEALVQAGPMKVSLPLVDLRVAQKAARPIKSPKKSDVGGYSVEKDLNIASRIDLRGLSLMEAEPLVDKLLDNALWAGLHRVEIIHGKGTGRLKLGLNSYLKEHRLVKSIRPGYPAEGGEGVTVVEIVS